MKRRLLTAAALCLAVLLSLGPPAAAASQPEISLSWDQGVRTGDTLEVRVIITGNPGINAVDFDLGYNRDHLKCISCAAGEAISGMMAAVNPSSPDGAHLSAASLTVCAGDGELAVVRFEVIADGSWDFELKNVIIANDKGECFSYTLKIPDEPGGPTSPQAPSGSGGGPAPGTSPTEPGTSPAEPGTAALPFTDVEGHWALDYILRANEEKLLIGYGGSKFGPGDKVSRAQFTTVLWRWCGEPEPKGEAGFTDLDPRQDYYLKAVAWAEETGIVQGTGGGRFDPEGDVTREQAATILHRLSGGQTGAEAMYSGVYDTAFSDSGKLPDWARPSVYWAIYHEVWCGRSAVETGDTLEAQAPATRAEIAVMVMKYVDNVGGAHENKN